MRRQTIAVLDIGDRPRFTKARLAATWAIDCLAEDRLGRGDIRAAATRDPAEVARYLLYPTRLYHVMAHGHQDARLSPDPRPFWPFHDTMSLTQFKTLCQAQRRSPQIECLLLDACTSNNLHWRTGLESLLPQGRRMVLIGTSRAVGWHEATTYTTSFYSVLLADALPEDPAKFRHAVIHAHRKAVEAFRITHRRPCAFRADELTGRA